MEFGPAVQRRFVDTADRQVTQLSSCFSQRAISHQAPSNVRRPMNSDRCRPDSTRTATLAARHNDLIAVAWGKATISSSEAARTKIGASIFDKRT